MWSRDDLSNAPRPPHFRHLPLPIYLYYLYILYLSVSQYLLLWLLWVGVDVTFIDRGLHPTNKWSVEDRSLFVQCRVHDENELLTLLWLAMMTIWLRSPPPHTHQLIDEEKRGGGAGVIVSRSFQPQDNSMNCYVAAKPAQPRERMRRKKGMNDSRRLPAGFRLPLRLLQEDFLSSTNRKQNHVQT